MENLNGKFKELHDYFRDKIVKGQYEIVKRDPHTYKVDIDGYTFVLWIANEAYGFSVDSGSTFDVNTMNIKFRVSDKSKAWNKIKKDIQKEVLAKKEVEEREQYERLKSKFETKS